jgi:hypothetical protein
MNRAQRRRQSEHRRRPSTQTMWRPFPKAYHDLVAAAPSTQEIIERDREMLGGACICTPQVIRRPYKPDPRLWTPKGGVEHISIVHSADCRRRLDGLTGADLVPRTLSGRPGEFLGGKRPHRVALKRLRLRVPHRQRAGHQRRDVDMARLA